MQVKHIRILTQMGSQFQQRLFYHQLEQLLKKKKKNKTKEQLKAGRFATKQMGLGESKEKRKKFTSDSGKGVNINQNAIPVYRVV